MKDKVYIVLALLGFTALLVVFVINFNPQREARMYAQEHFYSPPNVRVNEDDAQQLYDEMRGGRSRSCPTPIMSQLTAGDGVFVAGNNFDFVLLNNITQEKVKVEELALPDKTDPVELISLYGTESWTTDYVSIIAPFNFSYTNGCTNVSSPEVIEIEGSGYKVVFRKIANWYCAGPPGTSWEVKSGNSSIKLSWEDHLKGDDSNTVDEVEQYHHYTIIGDTKNANITGGNMGSVIGYASNRTTVECYKLEGKAWRPISLKELYEGAVTKEDNKSKAEQEG